MTEQYKVENRGAIWKNDRKESDTHPDFAGSANVAGVEYYVDAWRRPPDANPNSPALKFKFKRKMAQPLTREEVEALPPADKQEIPF